MLNQLEAVKPSLLPDGSEHGFESCALVRGRPKRCDELAFGLTNSLRLDLTEILRLGCFRVAVLLDREGHRYNAITTEQKTSFPVACSCETVTRCKQVRSHVATELKLGQT